MKLLVSGCSVTHGAELHNGFMSTENIKQSFSAHLAEKLGLELINVALSGGSNEYIFHSAIQQIQQCSDISHVLIAWTSICRLCWKANGRYYFFLPTWASSMKNLEQFKFHDRQSGMVWITGDNSEILDSLESSHKFFIEHYFDIKEMQNKTMHYNQAIEAICQIKGIKYHSITVDDIFNFLGSGAKHPNAVEHKKIAEFLYQTLYNVNNKGVVN